jgi:dolichol kinase
MAWPTEVKRKMFHHLSLIYLLLYVLFPRIVVLVLLGFVLIVLAAVEFLRLRRPEVNAWFIERFGGIHRESEIMAPSGIVWTLLGCWLTMLCALDKPVGVAAIGFLVFGDTAAALGGHWWGKTPWAKNPAKTREGTYSFVVVSILWAALFVRPHGAIIGAVFAAWVESLPTKWNDNLWVPLAGAFAIGISFGGKMVRGNPLVYFLPRIILYCAIFYTVTYLLQKKYGERKLLNAA